MSRSRSYPSLGAWPTEGGVEFRVWATEARSVEVVLEGAREVRSLEQEAGGTFHGFVPGIGPGALYRYRLDGERVFPDPASRFQPDGVHGPSRVVDPDRYVWRHGSWRGVARPDLVFYEVHVGTFTPEGTFEALRDKLPHLEELGITALELMPVADFPGRRNWGYDPAALFAPCRAYGTTDDLRELVDEAHGLGIAVFLDVVYNHLGPDGAYLPAFSEHFFTDRHRTPWGRAVNLDGAGSDGVRRFLIANALHWLREYRFDGLRLDATHALVDESEPHFLTELSAAVADLPGPRRYLVAEDHRNLRTLLEPRDQGGHGLDAVWADDFHHQIRRYTAGDSESYYRDFTGGTAEIGRTLERGWFFSGQVSEHEGGPRGSDPSGLPKESFVFCIQNHDQVGNRAQGNRLSDDVSLEAYHAATAILLFAPESPLLFMGQEWAASSPFQYFTDHHEELGRLVSEGRRKEFAGFGRFSGEDVPDPQDPATFERSKLNWHEADDGRHAGTLRLYRDLLALRRTLIGDVSAESPLEGALVLRRGRHLLITALRDDVAVPVPRGAAERWRSDDGRYAARPDRIQAGAGNLRFSAPGAVLFAERS